MINCIAEVVCLVLQNFLESCTMINDTLCLALSLELLCAIRE